VLDQNETTESTCGSNVFWINWDAPVTRQRAWACYLI
jgi:hypothetical protein